MCRRAREKRCPNHNRKADELEKVGNKPQQNSPIHFRGACSTSRSPNQAVGEQDLAWRFIDRVGEGHPPARAWIDQVRYVPDTSKVGIGLSVQSLTNDLLRMLLIGPAETRVGLESSPDLVSWSPLPLSPVTLSTRRDVAEVPRPSTTLFYRAAPPP